MKNQNKTVINRTIVWALFLFLTFLLPLASYADDSATSTPTSTPPTDTPAPTSTPALPTLAETEKIVRDFFVNDPIMIAIAKCESSFRQYTDAGEPFKVRNLYIGIFQIDEKIHAQKAKDMGMDIYTVFGNTAYAKYLKDQAGTRPWLVCAKYANAVTVTSTAKLTLNLKLGMENKEVITVQKLLNQAGFVIAKSGVGSPGHETAYFGSLTRAALKRFQCDKGIACSGSETTTGYGAVGPKTRAALLKTALAK